MTSKAKVAIIIPVYNVEKYLRQCLDSVVNQTLKDIEIICVDDGSTDSCPEILQEYAARDKRLKVITQTNAGQGAARNNGLQYVTAPYVYFADSDDWLALTCLEKLYQKMEQTAADIGILGVYYYDETQQEIVPNKYYDMSFFQNRSADICRYTDIKDAVFRRWAPFFRIHRTEFLRQNNILFPERVQYEDALFHVKCMILAQKITFCDENLYFYRANRPNSTMLSSIQNRYSFYIYDFLQGFDNFLHEQNIYEDMKEEYVKCFIGQIRYHLSRISYDLSSEFTERAEQYLQEYNLMRYLCENPDLNNMWHYALGKKYKVSVIIPIYNVDKYLPKCLDSVINQTFKPLEIICIDDGSTDSCAEILQQYAAKDSRIKVITQTNQQLSAARNTGIKQAQAEYLLFVDSDDWIEPHAVETMYNKMIEYNPDAVICDVANITDEEVIDEDKRLGIASYDKWFEGFSKPSGLYDVELDIRQQLAPVAWNKLYKTDIIRRYNLEFPRGLNQEDEFWLWAYMIHCKNFYFVAEKLYNYRHRPNSIMSTLFTSEKAFDIFEQYSLAYKHVKKYNDIVPYKPIFAQDFIWASNDRKKRIKPELYPQLLEKIRKYTFNCNPSDMMLDFYRKIRAEIAESNNKEKNTK